MRSSPGPQTAPSVHIQAVFPLMCSRRAPGLRSGGCCVLVAQVAAWHIGHSCVHAAADATLQERGTQRPGQEPGAGLRKDTPHMHV